MLDIVSAEYLVIYAVLWMMTASFGLGHRCRGGLSRLPWAVSPRVPRSVALLVVSRSVVSGVVVLLGVSAVEAVGVQRGLVNETRIEKLIKTVEHRSFPRQ